MKIIYTRHEDYQTYRSAFELFTSQVKDELQTMGGAINSLTVEILRLPMQSAFDETRGEAKQQCRAGKE